jgi:hypothetical protein
LTVGVVASIGGSALGLFSLPGWAIFCASTALTLVAAALTYALTGPKEHAEPALWTAILFLVATLGGSWIYSATSDSGAPPANFATDTFQRFSTEVGRPPNTAPDGLGMPAGAVNTADCYVMTDGQIWIKFGNEEWLPKTEVRQANGYPVRLPPKCE